jgi:translation elongation factor EF-Ts
MGKIGSIVLLENATEPSIQSEVAKKIAMHSAAMNPLYLNGREVPESIKAAELEVSKGKLKKYVKQYCLLEQELAVVEDSISVMQYLKTEGKGADLKEFALFSF